MQTGVSMGLGRLLLFLLEVVSMHFLDKRCKELIVELDNVLTARDIIKTVYQNSQLKNVSGQAQESSSQIMLIYVHSRESIYGKLFYYKSNS